MTSMFLMLGGLFSSIVDSMLVKSTWMSSSGVCTLMGHRGALGTTPSNVQHLGQPCTRALQSSSIIGHQKCSCARANVLCWPWWPVPWWTPFKATVHWMVWTRKANTPSISPWELCWCTAVLCSGPSCCTCRREHPPFLCLLGYQSISSIEHLSSEVGYPCEL